MTNREIRIKISEYNTIEELSKEDQVLVKKAIEATNNSYAPYSQFNVGAALFLQNEKVIAGSNQENAAYPSGLCAERVALFYANSEFPNVPVKTIAICAKNSSGLIETPIPPCGSCRQVMLETEIRFNSDIKVILYGSKLIQTIESCKTLLPLHFDSENLNNDTKMHV